MTERLLQTFAILLAGLFSAERAPSPAKSEPNPEPDDRRDPSPARDRERPLH